MRKATLDKINDIKIMQQEGKSDIEIVRKKFGRNWKKYHDFMRKHDLLEVGQQFKNHELPYNLEIAGDSQTIKKDILEKNPLLKKTESIELFEPNELGKLRQLINNSDDLLALLQKTDDDIEEIEILEVPEELIKIKDLRVRSVRISQDIEKDFDDLVKDNKLYSKTALINHALKEYIKKYK